MPDHHPLIQQWPRESFCCAAGFRPDTLLPIMIDPAFERGMPGDPPEISERDRMLIPGRPAIDDEYFDWIALLSALTDARDQFVCVEAGAGYGRWLVRAAAGSRARGLRFHAVAVESDPGHLAFLHRHFRVNGLNPDDHECYWGAVTPIGQCIPMELGRPDAWYGQAWIPYLKLPPLTVAERRRLKARAYLGDAPSLPAGHHWVPGLSLTEILSHHERVDFLHMDIQDAEGVVVRAAVRTLTDRVRWICVGTHSEKSELRVTRALSSAGWESIYAFTMGRRAQTAYGPITFGDGVQVWRNRTLPN